MFATFFFFGGGGGGTNQRGLLRIFSHESPIFVTNSLNFVIYFRWWAINMRDKMFLLHFWHLKEIMDLLSGNIIIWVPLLGLCHVCQVLAQPQQSMGSGAVGFPSRYSVLPHSEWLLSSMKKKCWLWDDLAVNNTVDQRKNEWKSPPPA